LFNARIKALESQASNAYCTATLAAAPGRAKALNRNKDIMKKLSVIISILTLLAVPACGGSGSGSGSDSSGGEAPNFTTGGETGGPAVADLDIDGDGAINASEWAASGEVEAFEDLDTDGDGLLTEDELSEVLCAPDCAGQTCGDDGCGGSCGPCLPGTSCTDAGVCESGDVTEGGGSEGTYTCPEIVECSSQCYQLSDDSAIEACLDGCWGEGTLEAQTSFGNYIVCLDTACSDATDADLGACIQAAQQGECAPAVTACFGSGGETGGGETGGGETGGGETGGGTTGGATCYDILLCINTNCASLADPTQCLNDCYGTGSAEAQSQFLALNDCVAAECPEGTPDPTSCAQQAQSGTCGTQSNTCISSGSSSAGNGTCQAIVVCQNNCQANPSPQQCVQECVDAAAPSSQTQFNNLMGCLQNACGAAADPDGCVLDAQQPEGACYSELNNCMTG